MLVTFEDTQLLFQHLCFSITTKIGMRCQVNFCSKLGNLADCIMIICHNFTLN